MLKAIARDFRIIFERDPAARNWLEVALLYPGFQALVLHRFAHWLWNVGIPFLPRLISHLARALTGIEIHPGAAIGSGVFIDHGMGVVIGETAIVGDMSLIYQGVTLGGTGKESGKRHPTIGTGVIVGAGAKVLGNIQIGNNVRIGAGSVVLREVPSDCTVVGVPGRILYRGGERVDPLEHGKLPDSEAMAIRALVDRIESLENELEKLQNKQSPAHGLEEKIASLEKLVAVGVGANSKRANSKREGELGSVEAAAFESGLREGNADSISVERCNGIQCCDIKDRAIQEFLGGSGI